MEYYEVLVRSHRYRQATGLTYSSDRRLALGSLVTVPLQGQAVMAVVTARVERPAFTCKPIGTVHQLPPLPTASLQLCRWLQTYYPTAVGPLAQLFLPASLKAETEVVAATAGQLTPAPLSLNAEQSAAVAAMTASGSYLLHGRTGSGKTRVYAALAQQTLQAGRSVIVLCPEISLTPQLATNLHSLLGIQPLTIHSKLTAVQRRDLWQQALRTRGPQVIVGPRSALFTPLPDIGLIVIDEAHEPAYKQEQQPYYYAPRVAAQLAHLHQARLILGSATPSVSEYFLAEHKQRPIIRLQTIATGQETPITKTIIDLKDRDLFTTSPYLSQPLIEAITGALGRQEQVLLYLNRRGTARLALCQTCGWQATCPHCDLPLTYHGDSHTLLCHTCGYTTASPSSCPTCGNVSIVFKSAGTKAILTEVQRLFPEARVQRFDTDNKKSERLEQHYDAVRRGEVDILVGTQLLAKGLDLPRLSTLGVILADSSLTVPDYTAQERTYQLLLQVIGRIGRGHTSTAHAIIQTYNPTNATIQAALAEDWTSFYDRELAERRQFHFPPFCHLLQLTCRRASARAAQAAAEVFQKELRDAHPDLEIDGPSPAFHEKNAGKYEWQLIVKAKQRSHLLNVVKKLPKSGWSYDIDPINLL